ncbi:hypothetical protein PHYSODRAFT_288713 [Phytophthora sojae]|uniref:RxLR effector protein n=2 Tax=Phytophthora sojae TaxID=67593 RepID=G5A753_PHYSP|nr:hypothetical protein PHYSODRAFT_288713 [Phytophthora sojae]AEK81267.1 Avh372 [Phytophthora sojae]AEK81268.1 Avh372 [Phytophthora sojae]AEK81269.1 Avh372 [Phytophthora sojae]EGZ09158.1 hypothetical protein PHYSODRAFT_288713 [Phytophthora sojae]|eukprot:XP_009535791.1 hypothetical protein PHYSODRAFT_288713 [Phytophthora sojae]
MLELALTFSVVRNGLADVAGNNQVAGSAITLNNEGTMQRKLRSSPLAEDDSDDEERALNINAGFSKVKTLSKKNRDLTKTLQKVESTKISSKEVAAVRSVIEKSPDKLRSMSERKKWILIIGVVTGVLTITPAVTYAILKKVDK